jgi:Rrf2 family protein
VRISAKVDYAIRAMTELSVSDVPITAERIADAQDLPLRYLLGILGDLRRSRLVQSQRGPEGGFTLALPAEEISLADVFRAIDGPLAEVHDLSLTNLEYKGPAVDLRTVWLAVRASLRRVLETVSLADVASGQLPVHVIELAEEYENAVADRPPGGRAESSR